jgi:hypothetical protein
MMEAICSSEMSVLNKSHRASNPRRQNSSMDIIFLTLINKQDGLQLGMKILRKIRIQNVLVQIVKLPRGNKK